MGEPTTNLRVAELLASLSLATDLGTGQPLGHGLRTCLLAVKLADEMGLDTEHVRSVHRVSLLRFLGCTADSFETARAMGGDEISFNANMAQALYGSTVEMMGALIGAIGPGKPLLRRAGMVAAALSDSEEPARGLAAHCEVATMLAHRLGMEDRVSRALQAAYERWDGKGYPEGLEGDEIPVEVRIVPVARDVDLFSREGEDVKAMLVRRRGKAYDPEVVDAFMGMSESVPEADWDAVLEADPEPATFVVDVDSAFQVMADFVDLKSPWTRGHSRKVAEWAEGAAAVAGLEETQTERLRHAALVHDLGRVGVENGIWDKSGPLTLDEWEKVRLHPYLTQRILSRCQGLAVFGELASSHHERLDGSGYHRQSSADQIPLEARILAAADVLAALTSNRPHRKAVDLETAADVIREEVDDRLDRKAVEWVIAAAGGAATVSRSTNPAGLTDREVEVLRLISNGLINREMAERLFISPKTVGRHIENIYAKIGVSTRAGAAVYAMEHRLVE